MTLKDRIKHYRNVCEEIMITYPLATEVRSTIHVSKAEIEQYADENGMKVETLTETGKLYVGHSYLFGEDGVRYIHVPVIEESL